MRQIIKSILLHELIWFIYSLIIYASPEDRISAKIFMLLIFIYLASVISYLIGKTKHFVMLSLIVSAFCFPFIKMLISLVI